MARLAKKEFLKKIVGKMAGKGYSGKGGPVEDKGKKEEEEHSDEEESKKTEEAEEGEEVNGCSKAGKGGPKRFPSMKFKKLLSKK